MIITCLSMTCQTAPRGVIVTNAKPSSIIEAYAFPFQVRAPDRDGQGRLVTFSSSEAFPCDSSCSRLLDIRLMSAGIPWTALSLYTQVYPLVTFCNT